VLRGQGDVYSRQGHSEQAQERYRAARELAGTLPSPVREREMAGILLRSARLALSNGHLGDALTDLEAAKPLLAVIEPPAESSPLAEFLQGQWEMTLGNFAQAGTHFDQALRRAEAQQESLLAAECLLAIAQARLSQSELDTAADTFRAAGRQFQQMDSMRGDGQAMLGVAQTLVGQQAWEQAREHGEGALTRFQQSDDQPGQADAQFTLGLALHGSGETQVALNHLEQALALYRQQQQPLGEADTLFELAGINLEQGQPEQALRALTDAIALVERVRGTLPRPEQQRAFLQQYAELYTLTAITQVEREQEAAARQVLESYARMAGSRALSDYMQAYEDQLSAADEDVSAEEVQANKNLAKRLKQLRKTL
jgi:tetratricopeptide (TPR) repeat protein